MDRYTRPVLFLKSEKSGFKAARLSLIMENLPPWSRNCMKSNAIVFRAAWALSACIQWRAKALISYALIATGGPIHLLPPPLTGDARIASCPFKTEQWYLQHIWKNIFIQTFRMLSDCHLNHRKKTNDFCSFRIPLRSLSLASGRGGGYSGGVDCSKTTRGYGGCGLGVRKDRSLPGKSILRGWLTSA